VHRLSAAQLHPDLVGADNATSSVQQLPRLEIQAPTRWLVPVLSAWPYQCQPAVLVTIESGRSVAESGIHRIATRPDDSAEGSLVEQWRPTGLAWRVSTVRLNLFRLHPVGTLSRPSAQLITACMAEAKPEMVVQK